MALRAVCENYFTGFSEISHFRENDRLTNFLASLKILSYLSLVIPIGMGLLYGASLLGRARIKKDLTPQEKKIRTKSQEVLELNKKGKKTDSPHVQLTSPMLLSKGEPIKKAQEKTKALLACMIKEGKVITRAQFDKEYEAGDDTLWSSQSQPSVKYWMKGGSGIGFDRLIGKTWIDQVAKENHCDKIKTPDVKIALPESVPFFVSEQGFVNFKLNFRNYGKNSIYVEQDITEVDRKLSVDEALQLATVLAKARYSDYMGKNFIIAKDGVYLIDLEQGAFSYSGLPKFDQIHACVLSTLNDADKVAFTAQWDQIRSKLNDPKKWSSNQNFKFEEKVFQLQYKNGKIS